MVFSASIWIDMILERFKKIDPLDCAVVRANCHAHFT